MMQIKHGLLSLEAVREHLKVGKPIDQLDLDFIDYGLSQIKFNMDIN